MGFFKKKSNTKIKSTTTSTSQMMKTSSTNELKTNLQQNIQTLKDTLGSSSDIIIREILIGKEGTIKAGIIYTDGLTDTPSLQNFVLETLMLDINGIELQEKVSPKKNLISVLKDVAMTVGDIKEITNLDVLFTDLLSGDTIILIDGYAQGLVISNSTSTSTSQMMETSLTNNLKTSLQQNIQTLKDTLGESSDIIIREILIGKEGTIKAGIIYTDGLTDTPSLQNFILETLMLDIKGIELQEKTSPEQNLISVLKDVAMTVGDIKEITNLDVLFTSLLSGDTIILIDGYAQGLIISNRHWVERGVTEPAAQTVVRGPREGFNENLRVNTALIRRKIKDPNLWMESKIIGTRTKTNIAIVYINGIASDKIVKEVRLRLDRINIDGILESGNIEEFIQDTPYSPFPTVFNTERPDVVAAALLEGRIAILVDGTPFVLIVPALFIQFFQASEDYYMRSFIGSLTRLLRFLAFAIALLAPALFIAITTFHHTMIPPALLISLAAQREGVPFPAFVEALIMEVTFEILREAGVRMPRAIGSAMSIVGAFVIGTAAVEAGIISAMMVIVVSITAISSFVSPSYDIAISVRMLRFAFMALAASFGLFGITVGLIALILHLCSLRSFGVPYMTPIAPFNVSDQKDTFIVLPIWKMFTRPRLISQQNRVRQQDPASAKPAPPKK